MALGETLHGKFWVTGVSQVILRLLALAQLPTGSWYAYSQLRRVIHPAKNNPKHDTPEFVKAGMTNLPVN